MWRWGRWVDEPPAPQGPGDRRIRLLQLNFCGSNCNHGSVGAAVDALLQAILLQSPHLVLLNELCLAQAGRLSTLLDQAGMPMSGAFGITTGHSRCPGEAGRRWYGNAVFSGGAGIGAPDVIALPNRRRAREVRSAVSMVTGLHGVPVTVSSAHLVPRSHDPEFNGLQLAALVEAHGRLPESSAVVFGGDFNATPDQVAVVPPSGGRFREVDHAAGSPTYQGRKLDFIFLSRTRFEGLSAHTEQSRYSDHRQLWAEAMLKD